MKTVQATHEYGLAGILMEHRNRWMRDQRMKITRSMVHNDFKRVVLTDLTESEAQEFADGFRKMGLTVEVSG